MALLLGCLVACLGLAMPPAADAAPAVAADADGWTIRRQEDGIAIATCPVADSKHDAVRRMRDLLLSGRYADARFDFLARDEPDAD